MRNNTAPPHPCSLYWYCGPNFGQALSNLGWETTIKKRREAAAFAWRELFSSLPQIPDVLVIGDNSGPPPLLDPHTCPCLTVFYSIDAHIHSWHPLYAQAFDLCLVSLKDRVPAFVGTHLAPERILWSPPFVQDNLKADAREKIWDVLFVGKVDEKLTPKRFASLKALAAHLPQLQVRQGNFAELFPQAKVVLNFCDLGDLNFRVFEALGCASALITPRIGHGQEELFTPGEDLWLYEPGNSPEDVGDLLKQTRRLLADQELREKIARNGHAKVNAAHRATHRAQHFTDWLREHSWPDLVSQRLHRSHALFHEILRPLYLHISEAWPLPDADRQAYFQAAKNHAPSHNHGTKGANPTN